MKPVRLLEKADQDLRGAVQVYRAESVDLANRFLSSTIEAFDFLSRSPSAGSLRLGFEVGLQDLRSWRIKGFPYLIFYRDDTEMVLVSRILHGSRHIPTLIREEA